MLAMTASKLDTFGGRANNSNPKSLSDLRKDHYRQCKKSIGLETLKDVHSANQTNDFKGMVWLTDELAFNLLCLSRLLSFLSSLMPSSSLYYFGATDLCVDSRLVAQ